MSDGQALDQFLHRLAEQIGRGRHARRFLRDMRAQLHERADDARSRGVSDGAAAMWAIERAGTPDLLATDFRRTQAVLRCRRRLLRVALSNGGAATAVAIASATVVVAGSGNRRLLAAVIFALSSAVAAQYAVRATQSRQFAADVNDQALLQGATARSLLHIARWETIAATGLIVLHVYFEGPPRAQLDARAAYPLLAAFGLVTVVAIVRRRRISAQLRVAQDGTP